jgi:uncharacterized paraquat-inducible protein A
MSHTRSGLPRRSHGSVMRWLRGRMQECVQCSDCQSSIAPFTSHCPNCGQANPAKVSVSAAVYLVLGFALLILMLFVLATVT